jgi:hypothetical protein
VLARGLPAFLGVDMSTKLSQGKIFLPMSYVDFEAGEDGVKDVWFGLLGPVGTTAANFARAAGYMEKGDMLKAIEYSVPKGVRSATETFRLATEGFSLSNGDIVIDPREINIGSLMLNAMGLPSTEINKIKWTRGQQYELTEYFSSESSRLRNKYIDAKADRDRAKQKELRQEWRDLQASKDRRRPFSPRRLRFGNSPIAGSAYGVIARICGGAEGYQWKYQLNRAILFSKNRSLLRPQRFCGTGYLFLSKIKNVTKT